MRSIHEIMRERENEKIAHLANFSDKFNPTSNHERHVKAVTKRRKRKRGGHK